MSTYATWEVDRILLYQPVRVESSPVENIIYDPKHSFLACSTQATHRIWTISNRFAGYNGHLHIIYYDYIDPLTPPFRILYSVGVCTYYSGANKLIPISSDFQ